ncbi:MAG: GNAT family N-acetyltransferase [Micrococcales bacterium]
MDGKIVSLRPLEPTDAELLWDSIGDDEATWRWVGMSPKRVQSLADLQQEIAGLLAMANAEFFVIQDKHSGKLIGSTAFLDIRPQDRHLEIGHTFLAPAFRGGKRNVEAKFLLLTEAFENRAAVRVTIKANALNVASRHAIEKIGARFEGLLRNQRLERDGTWRTAAYYSVILEEWPETKDRLTKLLSD